MTDQDSLLILFIDETRDHLEQAEACLLRMSKDAGDDEALQACFRALHSVKGCAGYFDLERVQVLAHACETLLERLSVHDLTASQESIEALLAAVTALSTMIGSLKNGTGQASGPPSPAEGEVIARLQTLALAPAAASVVRPKRAPVVATTPLAELAETLNHAEELLHVGGEMRAEQIGQLDGCLSVLPVLGASIGGSGLAGKIADTMVLLRPSGGPCAAIDSTRRAALLDAIDHLRLLVPDTVPGAAQSLATRPSAAEASHRLNELFAKHGLAHQPDSGAGLVALGAGGEMAPADKHRAQEPARGSAEAYSRVPTARLEELVTLVGELLIDQATIANHPTIGDMPDIGAVVTHQSRIVRDLQSIALALRMVTLASIFRKTARAVHDTAYKLAKEVDLSIEGEATEIDRTITESLADPLLHMARNAVDHGIETKSERLAAGKPPTGHITLRAIQSGDHVIIIMTDDGRGLDPVRIRRKAIEKGLISAETALSDQEAYRLIFLPGFTTAEHLSEISGRGVGLDVVHRNVQDLKGSIHIDSTPGQGTTFQIHLPLTTAILDAMLLRVGAQRFLVPVASVMEARRIRAGQLTAVMGSRRVVECRGQMLPVASLRDVLGITGTAAEQAEKEEILVVVNHFRFRYALLVNDIIGEQQVVIKPLSDHIPHHPGLTGSAILADGRVGLILDPSRLVQFGVAS